MQVQQLRTSIRTRLLGYGRTSFLAQFVLCLLVFSGVHAQKMEKIPGVQVVCPADFSDKHTHISAPIESSTVFQSRMQAAATAEFEVTFGPQAQANPQVIAAFQFALDIWAQEIVSSVPIKVFAEFATLGPGVLASAGPTFLVRNFPNAPQQDVNYPIALANALAGEVLLPDEEFDLVVNLGNSIDWYFGTDGNTPAGQFDFVTVALHEAGHGLGFTTSRNVTGGIGTIRSNGIPSVFSLFMVDGEGDQLLDFPDPSAQLGDALTGGDLFVNGMFARAGLGGNLPELYAPPIYRPGSSTAHWDEDAYPPGDPNSLMTPFGGRAESNFNIGDITRGHFKDMGWVLNNDPFTDIRLSPNNINIELPIDTIVPQTLAIQNASDSTLTVQVSEEIGSQIVSLTGTTEFTVAPSASDTLQFEINTNGIPKGVYEEGLLFEVVDSDTSIRFPVTIRVLDGTEAPIITVQPSAITDTIQQLEVVTRELTIENTGDSDLMYSIVINDSLGMERFRERSNSTYAFIKEHGFERHAISQPIDRSALELSRALTATKPFFDRITSSVYATGFEEFVPGDINGQLGWFAAFENNWIVSTEDPFERSQSLRGISDGLGGDRSSPPLAISPTIEPGDALFMTFSAQVNVKGEGTTWEVIPQSPTAGSVVTRVRFNPDRTLSVLTAETGDFVDLDLNVPEGYFELGLVVDKESFDFTLTIDDNVIFSGTGFAGVIEQIVTLSLMEMEGSTMDVDAIEVLDGDPDAFFVDVDPVSGTIPFGSSATVNVRLNGRNLDPGTYEASLAISSNDTTNSPLTVPISLTVIEPPTIVVEPTALPPLAVDVRVDDPAIKTDTITIRNTGAAPLEFTTALGPLNFSAPGTDSIPGTPRTANGALDLVRYGKGDTRNIPERMKSFPRSDIALVRKVREPVLQATFSDSIFYDTGINVAENFSGVDPSAYTSAIKFDTPNAFTLTAVRNYYQTDALQSATVILEICKGGDTPLDGELLSTQTIEGTTGPAGIFALEVLSQPLTFLAGESFWVVHKYPDGIPFPQGVDDDATQRPNTYFFSNDGGDTYNPSGFVFLVRALSGGAEDDYLTLEPASGTIAPGGSAQVIAQFDGTSLENGNYQRDILINSNDPNTPQVAVSTDFTVTGQLPNVEVSDELVLFDNVFIGDSLTKSVTIFNSGLAALEITDITVDNPDFTVDVTEPVRIAAEDSLAIDITFAPTSLGSINGVLSFTTNVEGQETIEVIVNGIGVDPPIAVLTPEVIVDTIAAGDTKVVELTLANEGNSPLTFSFPEFTVANAIRAGKVQKSNANIINFASSRLDESKGGADNRVGIEPAFSMGQDDSYGYTWIDSDEDGGPVYSFTDISTTGTNITEQVGADGQLEVDLPFLFDYYGKQNSSVFINANGLVSFAEIAAITFVNRQIPVDDATNGLIAGFWDDLEPQQNEGSLTYQSFADRFVIQWTNVNRFLRPAEETVTFQIILFPDGSVEMLYADVEDVSFDEEATVGIEDPSGTDGIQVAFNTEYLKNNLAIRFMSPAIPTVSFVSEITPTSGVIGAGRSRTIRATFDATELTDGVYRDDITVSTNAPDKSQSQTEVELTVIGQPQIELSVDRIAIDTTVVGTERIFPITVRNTGTKALTLNRVFITNGNFKLRTRMPVLIPVNDSTEVNIAFKPTQAGELVGRVTFFSDDAFGNESIILPLSGIAVPPPQIAVATREITVTIDEGFDTQTILSIANRGGSDLTYDVIVPLFAPEVPEARLAFAIDPLVPLSGTIAAGQSGSVRIPLETAILEGGASYTEDIVIVSNDQERSQLRIPVTINVIGTTEITSLSQTASYTDTDVATYVMYPNPVESIGYFSIDLVDSTTYHPTLVNMFGQVIQSGTDILIDKEGKGEIHMEGLAKGIYLLRVTDDNNKLLGISRIIKK